MEQQKSEKTKILILPRILQCVRAFGHLMLKSFFKKTIKKHIKKSINKSMVLLIDLGSIFDRFWEGFGSQDGLKIEQKSIKKSTIFLIIF